MKLIKEKKKLTPMKRIAYIVIGFIMATALLVYGINWNNPLPFSVIGIEIDKWINAGFMVIIGLIAASLIKSGLLGETRLD